MGGRGLGGLGVGGRGLGGFGGPGVGGRGLGFGFEGMGAANTLVAAKTAHRMMAESCISISFVWSAREKVLKIKPITRERYKVNRVT